MQQTVPGELSDQIRTIRVPTLIVWGRKDQLVPVENAERLHRAITGSTLVIFDQLGHVPHEEDPVRSYIPVKQFLRIP